MSKYVKLEDVSKLLISSKKSGKDLISSLNALPFIDEEPKVYTIKAMIAELIESNKQGYINFGLSDFKSIANDMKCLLDDINALPQPPTK